MRRARAIATLAIAATAAMALGQIDCGPGRFDGISGSSRAPRLVAPLSGSYAMTSDPTLRWELPSNVTQAVLETCADPECLKVLSATPVVGRSAKVHFSGGTETEEGETFEFAAPSFWRVRADGPTGPASPVWTIAIVPLRGKDTAWGISPDLNGDGNPELIIGLPAEKAISVATTDYVRVAPSVDECVKNVPIRRLRERPDLVGFGARVAIAGDVDGDGLVDLVTANATSGLARSEVTVFFGARGERVLREGPGVQLSAEGSDSSFGAAGVAGAGDIDGDGYADILVADSEGVFVVWGGKDGPVAGNATKLSVPGTSIGCVMAGAGDMDGDGLADFAVAGDCAAEHPTGRAFVYFGGRDRNALQRVEVARPDGITSFGQGLGLAGDIDRDGLTELFVGAPVSSKAFLFRGRPDRTIELFSTLDGQGRPGFGSAMSMDFLGDACLSTFWVAARGDLSTPGTVTEWPAFPGEPIASLADIYPEYAPALTSRVFDLTFSYVGPPMLALFQNDKARGVRPSCEADGGFDAVETFVETSGDLVFAR